MRTSKFTPEPMAHMRRQGDSGVPAWSCAASTASASRRSTGGSGGSGIWALPCGKRIAS